MYQTINICGMQIPLSEIRDYKLIKKDFIFRPAYIEIPRLSLGWLVSPTPYKFDKMVPYAQLITENEYKNIISNNNTPNIRQAIVSNIPSGIIGLLSKGSVVSDLASGVVSGVVDSVSNKFSTSKKDVYYCLSLSGRPFTTKLKDVHPMLTYSNGSVTDVDKKDAIFRQLTGITKASVSTVDVLLIVTTGGSYLFYGSGIQLDDVNPAYSFLCQNIPLQNFNGFGYNQPQRF